MSSLNRVASLSMACGMLVYVNSLRGRFVMDDSVAVRQLACRLVSRITLSRTHLS